MPTASSCWAEIPSHGHVGRRWRQYLARLQQLGIDTRYVGQAGDTYTAQAMIMTDRDNNQITAFHPGAMMQAHANRIGPDAGARISIIAPDGRDAMLQHAAPVCRGGHPLRVRSGQGLPMFDGDELRRFVAQAGWIAVNDYEGKMLCDRTGWSLAELSQQVTGLVVTLGAEGCEVWEQAPEPRSIP